jgi:3-phenylpropionate/trans-cinnamate dioxygenase ferredoxin subunit
MFNYIQLDPSKLEFIQIAPLTDLPPGGRLFIELDGKAVVVFNLAGSFFAIGDVCTHDNGPLGDGELDEHEVVCPRHGARFDIRSGKAMGLPAVVDIPAYPVRVVDGMIQIGIPNL